MLIFGGGPLFFFFVGISPAAYHISDFKERVHARAAGASRIPGLQAAVSRQESERLDSMREAFLIRFKKIDGGESLLHFSGTLADALAMRARSCGLKVTKVDLQNPWIQGSYAPENDRALDALNDLPAARWGDLCDPLDLPILRLPSIEIQMTVACEYSKVFSFIESLPEFPAQVSLTGLASVNDLGERGFRLKIRGYYLGGDAGHTPREEKTN